MIALFLASLLLAVPSISTAQGRIQGYPRVIDGDTIAFGKVKIRIEGIDAPEITQRCRRADDSVYRCGQLATSMLRARIGLGKVSCEIMGKGKYGRYIGICHAQDGVDLNAWMVRTGWAVGYRKYSNLYVQEEKSARIRKIGMWSGSFEAPWEWRRMKRERRKR